MKQQYGTVTDAQCKVQVFLCTAWRHIVMWKWAIAALVLNVGRTNPMDRDAIPTEGTAFGTL